MKPPFYIIAFALTLTTLSASAQVTFTDVSQEAGITNQSLNSIAVAWGDYDNDGDLDLYVAHGLRGTAAVERGPNVLYRNNGDGTFTYATDEADLGNVENIGGWFAGFMDYDNDGYPDLYVESGMPQHTLYRNNGDGTYTDVTREIGIETPGNYGDAGATFGDYDSDGDLDIYFTNTGMGGVLYENMFYENNGDGTFTYATDRSGLGNTLMGMDVTSVDYDNDGDLDIYLANALGDADRLVGKEPQPATLYRNNGDGTFTDVAQEAGLSVERDSRDVISFDYDNDGDLDIYAAGVSPAVSSLYSNNGDGTFTDVAREAGVLVSYSYSLTVGDYDNDGYIDIFVMAWGSPRALFHNNGDGTFTNVAGEAGVGSSKGYAGGCAFADYDNDGDLDLYVAYYNATDALYRNNGSGNNWLRIKPVGTISNIDGIGARVTVRAGELSMMREINNGNSRGQHELAAHFGLGRNARVDTVEIRWPSGQVDVLRDIPANRFIMVGEGVGIVEARIAVRVTGISPQEGRVTGGEPIAIFGAGFPEGAIVTIGGKPLTDLTVTDTIITGITPPGTEGESDILIEAPDYGYSKLIGKFTYNPPTSIVLTGITPDNGKLAGGDVGRITGSGFLPGATVTIGGNPAADVGVNPTLIVLTIPPGTEGAKDVVVMNPDGGRVTLRGGYTYNPFPVIEKVEPLYGGPLKGGTDVTITGSNFMEGVVVTIGENRVYQLTFFSPTELRLETPPGPAGPKPVSVTNPDGQEAVKEDAFTYNPAPTISSISPNAGPLEGGTPIIITGEGFFQILRAGSPDVFIGDAEAEVEAMSSTQIRAITGSSDAGIKDIVVINPDGQKATLRNAFTYNTAPVITRVTPDNGRLAGGTRITIQGGGFQPGAEVRISINQGAYRSASSVEVMSSSIITALTPPGQPGAENVLVLNPDVQIAVLPEGYTYNPMPVITRLIPNHGPSSGGATITIEGSGFFLGARVVIGEKPATTMVRDDMTIEAVAPPIPQGVWDVRVINPDTQEVGMPGGYVSAGEVAYNYPNPFHASRGTTFRFVTKDPVLSVTVKIFNLRGRPIGAARQIGSNEVKWVDPDVYAGLYIYLLEAELEGGKRKQVRNVMEVME
jgi:hypothetical protein